VNKLCDAADWFRPEVDRIIRDDFEDVPRFHRKQWEFAVIYRELEQRGLLRDDCSGISFGSGTEHLLYSIARRVKHIWATDLYGATAAWDIVRTESALELIRSRAPFPYPEERISAKTMDMREIDFPDGTFDFAYSSCAIEHIGKRDDFIRHLREVSRVLKPGGVYAFTTELTYADRTVELEGNYYFSRSLLEDIIRGSGLDSDPEFDASLTDHRINTPLPVELSFGFNDGEGRFNEKLFGLLCHVQLAWANVAFTSCVVVLRKTGKAFEGWRYKGWDETRRFIGQGIDLMRAVTEESDLTLHPFAWMPDRKSQRYVGHAEYFRLNPDPATGNTLFHTAYVWLGAKPRLARVSLRLEACTDYRISLLVYRRSAAVPGSIEVEAEIEFEGTDLHVSSEFELSPRDDHTYAFLAVVTGGDMSLREAYVTCAAAGVGPMPRDGLSPSAPGKVVLTGSSALPDVQPAQDRPQDDNCAPGSADQTDSASFLRRVLRRIVS
jgi:SAM-dependent methyltransferase